MSPLFPRQLPLLCSLLLSACGDLTALDLSLVADPNVNDAETLVQELRSLRVILDAPGGLYASLPASPGPELELRDIDGDGELELIAEHPVEGLGHLPRIRLERGGLQAEAIDLRLDGSDSRPGEAAAEQRVFFAAGGVRGIRFDEEQIRQVEVPFNRRLLYRQPQVTQINPEDGASVDATGLNSIRAIFSKKMDVASLQQLGVLRLVRLEGDVEIEEPPAEPPQVTNLGGLESPALAEYRLAGPLQAGNYRFHVSAGARDAAGRPLDQVPMQTGDQPFASSFNTTESYPSPQTIEWCEQGGLLCSDGLSCNPTTRRCELRCPDQCPVANCCDPALGFCVPDCRVHGSYGGCPEGERCLDSGLCGP